MLKLFFGIIIFYFCLSNTTIEHSIRFPSLIPTTPTRNENWNEYIVLSGNNFLNNYYIKPLRIKKKN